MRVTKAVVVLFLAAFLSAGVTAAQEKKATTVDELAKMYDVSSCKQCHAKEFDEWAKSIHAKSLIGTGRTMATIKTAIQDGMMKEWAKSGIKEVKDIKVEHMLHCLKCHLPQLKDATDAVAQQIAKAVIDGDTATLEKVNINCIICHNRKAIVHKMVDGEPEPNVIYGYQGRLSRRQDVHGAQEEPHHEGVHHLRPVPRPGPQLRTGQSDAVRHAVRELSA